MLHGVPEFSSAAEMLAHYARLRRQTYAPRPRIKEEPVEVAREPLPKPEPVKRDILDLRERKFSGPKARARHIMRETAAKYDLDVGDLISWRRGRKQVDARQEAMARIYVECPTLSLPLIAGLFARDHTTVLHACKKLGVWPRGGA